MQSGKKDPEAIEDFEEYFSVMIQKSAKKQKNEKELNNTLDHVTLSMGEEPPFDGRKYASTYETMYKVIQEFNILCYGVGSKIEFLRQFCNEYLSCSMAVIEIDGFTNQNKLIHGGITALAELLDVQTRDLDDLDGILAERSFRACFLIHSIDTECFLNEDSFAKLLSAKNIRVIASATRQPFIPVSYFYPIHVDTFRRYEQELSVLNGLDTKSQANSSDRFEVVLGTLTDTAKSIFKTLARFQIETGTGLSYHQWFERSQNDLMLRLSNTFQIQINEFLDHKLIVMKRSDDDVYTIPLPRDQLEALIEKI